MSTRTTRRLRTTKRSGPARPRSDSPSPPPTPTSPNLGAALRRLRFERRLSIADVAVATGIAKSTLSRVENDQLSLTYAKLLQLCRGLQIDFAELFSHDPDAGEPPPSGRRTYSLPGAGPHIKVGKIGYDYLCTDLAGKKITPMLVSVSARSLEEANGLWKHDGEEFIYVVSGRLQLHTEFYEPLTLETGATAYFDSTMAHAFVSIGEEPLRVLSVCTAPDPLKERVKASADQGSRLKSRSSKS